MHIVIQKQMHRNIIYEEGKISFSLKCGVEDDKKYNFRWIYFLVKRSEKWNNFKYPEYYILGKAGGL